MNWRPMPPASSMSCWISDDVTPVGLSTTTFLAASRTRKATSKWVPLGVATTTSLMDESAEQLIEGAARR